VWSWGVLTSGQYCNSAKTSIYRFNWLVHGTGCDVGIGTIAPGSYKLAVKEIGAREVNVITTTPWPDYVFAGDYKLPSLEPSSATSNRISTFRMFQRQKKLKRMGESGEMNVLLLKKVEELTLYMIEQQVRSTN